MQARERGWLVLNYAGWVTECPQHRSQEALVMYQAAKPRDEISSLGIFSSTVRQES